MYKHILIAADGSKTSTKAVRHGLKLAKSVGASKVTIVSVTEMLSALAMSAGMDAGMALPFEDYERDAASGAEKILSDLLPRSVRLHVFQAFLDAAVSEQTARRMAMKNATDAANDIIKDLTMLYNRSRQTQITTELSEIIGGAAALE